MRKGIYKPKHQEESTEIFKCFKDMFVNDLISFGVYGNNKKIFELTPNCIEYQVQFVDSIHYTKITVIDINTLKNTWHKNLKPDDNCKQFVIAKIKAFLSLYSNEDSQTFSELVEKIIDYTLPYFMRLPQFKKGTPQKTIRNILNVGTSPKKQETVEHKMIPTLNGNPASVTSVRQGNGYVRLVKYRSDRQVVYRRQRKH